jgi:hypothetical protein
MQFLFFIFAGKAIYPQTAAIYDYSQFYMTVNGRTHVVFTVKACNDAHIALSTIPGNFATLTMEFVIGGWSNTRSAIRQCMQCATETEVSTPNILSCTEHRAFWISWSSGSYKVS